MKILEIERCKRIALERFGVAPEVTVAWDVTGTYGGWCKNRPDGTSHLRLNLHLAKHEGERYIKTIAHEYAHAVAWAHAYKFNAGHRYQPHGNFWGRVMLAFGYEPDRCHDYKSAVKVRQTETYRYACGCKQHLVGPTVHKRMQAGRTYTCNNCRLPLVQDSNRTAEDLLAVMAAS